MPEKRINPMEWALLEGAARLVGVPSTVVRRRLAEVAQIALPDGTRLVRIADVRRIKADPLKRGRPVRVNAE